eukprot:5490013-Alexandrium_andersonii.AAC.1
MVHPAPKATPAKSALPRAGKRVAVERRVQLQHLAEQDEGWSEVRNGRKVCQKLKENRTPSAN